MELKEISRDLARRVDRLVFGTPVTHVYNPLVYARASHEAYLDRFGGLGAQVLLVGMNPGPFGMAQTGVPFGEIGAVRDWMGIDETIGRPPVEHPKRPIVGLSCERSEVSGARLWGWARERFSTPQAFFSRFFVANYCPLVFMEDSGRNRTPDKLAAAEREALYAACDQALRATVQSLAPRLVVGIGAFAQGRARKSLDGLNVPIGVVLHPSPASPKANRGWAAIAERELSALGIALD